MSALFKWLAMASHIALSHFSVIREILLHELLGAVRALVINISYKFWQVLVAKELADCQVFA